MPLRFRPPLWSILPTVLLTGLFLVLGSWQLSRAQHKRALEAAFGSAAAQGPLDLSGADVVAPDSLAAPRAVAQGRYETAQQLLLDNQTRQQRPGYRVWTPMRLSTGQLLIVDRGWLPQNPDRRVLPDVWVDAAEQRLEGYWRPLPEPGLRLVADNCGGSGFPRVVSYPTLDDLGCLLGTRPLPGVLLLAPEAAHGYVREWTLPNPVPPSRHYAYAAQWFAFAATLLGLFVKLNLRRQP